jgi:NADPH:quinone reductase-like Zn-dependent oxidoreductase
LAEAAALPTAGMTALAGVEALGLAPDTTLVIAGASGGVGSFATELAASRGARVIALARATSASRLKSFGAAEVADPTDPGTPAALARAYPNGVDALLDAMSGPAGFARFASLVHRGGTALSTTFAADVAALSASGVRGVNLNLIPDAALMERLVREVVGHRLRVPLERRVSLAEAPTALAESKAGHGRGKTVVALGD